MLIGQTDGWMPDCYIVLSARCGQSNNQLSSLASLQVSLESSASFPVCRCLFMCVCLSVGICTAIKGYRIANTPDSFIAAGFIQAD